MVVLGIDIGGAQIRAGMVDEEGAILASRTIPTPSDLDGLLPSLQDAIRWLLEATALPAGVGVGCKGIINPDSTVVETVMGGGRLSVHGVGVTAAATGARSLASGQSFNCLIPSTTLSAFRWAPIFLVCWKSLK